MRLRRPIWLGAALALAPAAPAAADVEVRGLDTLQFDKPIVSIAPGETVTWSFDGTSQFHNVKSTSGNWNWESQLGQPAPRASFRFTTAGTYEYLCRVHPDTMTGKVLVAAPGEPPPPPPSPPLGEQPLPNDSPLVPDVAPTALERGGLDTTRPRLRSVRVQRMRRGAWIRFRVSERARVTVRFERGRKVVETRHVNAAGSERLTVRGKALRAGRYRVALRAEDVAGNRSGVRTARLTVR